MPIKRPIRRRRKPATPRWWTGRRLTAYGKQAISVLVLVGTLFLREQQQPMVPAKRDEEQPPSWASDPPPGLDWGSISTSGRLIPKQPFKGQKTPPCSEPYQRIINDGCWMLVGTAPCPGVVYEYDQRCYQPVEAKPEARLPTSVTE